MLKQEVNMNRDMLDIMKKARAYDKALKRVKEWVTGKYGYDDSDTPREIAEFIFPELKETEDEKMWKAIYNAIKYLETELSWDFLDDVDILDVYAWLEKQSNKSQGKSVLEAIKEEKIDNTDRVEPKFMVGDWVVTSYGKVNQVISVDEDGYGYTLDNGFYFSGSWCDVYHLWTIKDAKDGNVLITDSRRPFIFKGCLNKKYPNSPVAYCGICSNGDFGIGLGINRWTDENVYPATKEQCDILFRKMKEAGYEWDVKKKELKKIEDVPENYKRQVMSEMTNLVKDYIQQKPTWSEDDEKMFQTIIADLKGFKHDNTSCLAPHFDNCIAWLNSLKDRYTWKPSDEQMDALNLAIGEANAVDTAAGDEAAEILTSLYEQLKKIMEK